MNASNDGRPPNIRARSLRPPSRPIARRPPEAASPAPAAERGPDIGDRHWRQGRGELGRARQQRVVVIFLRGRAFRQRERADRRAVDAVDDDRRQRAMLRDRAGEAGPFVRRRRPGSIGADPLRRRRQDQIGRTRRRHGRVGERDRDVEIGRPPRRQRREDLRPKGARRLTRQSVACGVGLNQRRDDLRFDRRTGAGAGSAALA